MFSIEAKRPEGKGTLGVKALEVDDAGRHKAVVVVVDADVEVERIARTDGPSMPLYTNGPTRNAS